MHSVLALDWVSALSNRMADGRKGGLRGNEEGGRRRVKDEDLDEGNTTGSQKREDQCRIASAAGWRV